MLCLGLLSKQNTMPTKNAWTSIVDVFVACPGTIADGGRDFNRKLNTALSEDTISNLFSR